jgi:hypothetical protein
MLPKKFWGVRGHFAPQNFFFTKVNFFRLQHIRDGPFEKIDQKFWGAVPPKFFVGLYLENGEELNMRYSNHYCSPWEGEFNGVLQFDLDPIFKVKFEKNRKYETENRS